MLRPVIDFQKAAIDKQIRRWDIHTCSSCGYHCGYVIDGEGVFYDSGCDCSSFNQFSTNPSSWEELANHYNRNQPEKNSKISQSWLDEVNSFWGFDLQVISN